MPPLTRAKLTETATGARASRGTTGLAGTPTASQGHHGPVKGTTGLSLELQACQGHQQFFQMHRRPSTMAPCLAEVAIRRMSPRISRAFAVFSWFQTFKHGI